MIEFSQDYEFANDHGVFEAHAKTYAHGDYGNGTGLEISVRRDGYGYIEPILLDIRYTGIWKAEEVDRLVRETLGEKWHASEVWPVRGERL